MKKKLTIAGAACILMAAMTSFPVQAQDVIPEGIYAGPLDLKGLTMEEAVKEIDEFAEDQITRELVLTIGDDEIAVTAEQMGAGYQNPEEVTKMLEENELQGNLIRRYMKKKDLKENPVTIPLDLSAEEEDLKAFADQTLTGYLPEARDAEIRRENGEFVITPSVTGREIDLAATGEVLKEVLGSGDAAEVKAVIVESEPRVRTEDVSEIRDELGTYTTHYGSSGVSRSTNITVGSGKINGSILMPGEVLSGYELMQPFTIENGYRVAGAYSNGKTIDSVGGGVCQIATTLYNAALRSEMEIVQRQNHSMTVSYVEPSMDAAIAGTVKDLKFKNPYDYPVYVEGYTKGKSVTFTIYGKETRPANRTISFESETLSTTPPPAPLETVDPSLAPGARVKEQSGHTGKRSRLYKCIYVDGELTERTLLNDDVYYASRGSYRIGPPAPAVPPTPPVPEVPVTPVPEPVQPTVPPAPVPEGPGAENVGPGFGPSEPGPGAIPPA